VPLLRVAQRCGVVRGGKERRRRKNGDPGGDADKQLSEGGLWKGVDAGLIDGTVNGLGVTVRAASGALRRAQTGSIRTYAASLFLGVVLILGWYLWQ
jgi:hypothetical protein